ncbi:MAG: hypothetical protein DMF77_02810 [Acidobacteria bacterium]|nr:MAG: hypothetical protein DMF77_02810 [Acidobacteriota bacterium]
MNGSRREVRTIVRRAVALPLSWILTATSVWSVAPAVVVAAPAPAPVEEAAPPSAAAPRVTVFGPQRYVRTTGAKNEYTSVVKVPAWVRPPFALHVQNGELNGTYRVSSASIGVNGTIVAGTADFNVTVPSLDRAVVLTPETSLKVTLASKPTSYLVIALGGTSGDGTAPTLAITTPANGAFVDTTTPALAIEYRDLAGTGEAAASGVDVSTLEVWLDGALRTSWFARRSNDATAVVPAEATLAEGAHVLRARIADAAGNLRESAAQFTIDVTRPLVAVPQPAAGEFLGTALPEIRVQYQDANLDTSTLRVDVNGTDRTEWFQRGPTEAVAQVPAAQPLPTGPNQVVASISDRSQNKGTASTSFNIDVQAPAIAITQPARGSRHGSGRIEAIARYSDDQALQLSTFKATLDGGSITMAPGAAEATKWLEGLAEGRHVLSVEIGDRAGNVASDQSEFWVDTGGPSVSIAQPAPGAKVNTARPAIAIQYSDAQGLAVGSFKLMLDGFERTAWCAVNLAAATCTVPAGEAIGDGPHQIVATVSDLAANTGTGESGFTVDTVAPTASLVAPTAPTNVDPPLIELAFADVGTGVVPDSIHVFIDGEDHTGEFVRSETRAKGRPATALSQGPHAVQATVKDQAENLGQLEAGFVVDTEAPALAVTAPHTPFLNDARPGIAGEWSDAVSGVRGDTLKVVLVRIEPPETRDITSLLTPGPSGAEGAIPEAEALADGGFHIQATVSDAAGNLATATAAFQLDTKAPSVTIDDPAEGAWIRTALPSIALHFSDEGVGVDPTLTELLVDGADRSGRLTCAAGTLQCTAALLAEESLAEGGHTLAVTVHDRAGNASTSGVVAYAFSVDTHAPTVGVISPPRGSHVGSGSVPVLIQYGDPGGSGIHLGSLQVLVDGVDRTTEFTATESRASATLALSDGAHNVIANVADWAANPAAADGPFWVDTTTPTVSGVSPATETYVSELDPSGRLTFDGQAQDLDGDLTVTCTVGGRSYSGSFANGSISCAVPLGENDNDVQVTVTDRAGNHTDVGRTIVVDRAAPEIVLLQPPDGSYTNAISLAVTGQVSDLHLDTVDVAGVTAAVDGGGFSADPVPIGEPPDVTLTATAHDRAGNAGTSSVTLHVDRIAPEVHITSPREGAVLTSGAVEVGGTIDDASPIAAASVNDPPATSARTRLT